MRGVSPRGPRSVASAAAIAAAFLCGLAASSFFLRFSGSSHPHPRDHDEGDVVRRHLSDRGGGGGGGGADEEEEGYTAEEVVAVSSATLVIFLFLVVMTIGFDLAKEHAEEASGRHLSPMVKALFGELTVLGFLSAVTFVFAHLHGFQWIAAILTPRDDEERAEELADELFEIFEIVHFCLFFVMAVFVIQALCDVRQGMRTTDEWMELDRLCRDPNFATGLLAEKAEEERKVRDGNVRARLWRAISPYVLFLPALRSKMDGCVDERLYFCGLREEFILERSVDPPFRPINPRVRLGEDFNFGRYLSICLGKKMSHVVEIDVVTWSCLAVFGVFLYGVLCLVKGNLLIMAWIWVAIGYLVFFFNVYFESHLSQVIASFTPPLSVGDVVPRDVRSTWAKDALPGWCFVDLEQYHARRHRFQKWLAGKQIPNRHHTLFFAEHKGPTTQLFLLRMNLVFNGLYCALLVITFLPKTYRSYDLQFFVVYALLAVVPILSILFNKRHLIIRIVIVSSIGSFRVVSALAQARREERTVQAIRRLVILYKLRLVATAAEEEEGDGAPSHFTIPSNSSSGVMSGREEDAEAEEGTTATAVGERDRGDPDASSPLDRETLKEVRRAFDLLDLNGDGVISGDEFRIRMSGMTNAPVDEEGVRNFLTSVGDPNRSGGGREGFGRAGATAESFVRWYESRVGGDTRRDVEECAACIFRIFDTDRSGSISVSELKAAMDDLNMGFSIDEVGELVNEMDFNESGSLGKEEFEHLLVQSYPRELMTREDESAVMTGGVHA